MSQRKSIILADRRWALIPSNANKNHKIAIFVHGYLGGYLDTWGQLSTLLEQNADDDKDLANWDFLFLGYSMGSVQTYLDIARIISNEWKAASTASYPFTSKYKSVALIGHSLGTLGIRQLMCAKSLHALKFLDHLKCIILFGSPIVGSPWARLNVPSLVPKPIRSMIRGLPAGASITKNARDFFESSEALRALAPGNPQLRMLKEWTESVYDYSWPPLHVVHASDDAIVGSSIREFCHWQGDKTVDVEVDCGHLDLVKPKDWLTSPLLHHLRRDLRGS